MDTSDSNQPLENPTPRNDIKTAWESIKQFAFDLLDIRIDTDRKGTIEILKVIFL